MKVLLVGVGGVGEAIAAIAKERPWAEQIVLADYNQARAEEVQKKIGDPKRFPAEFIDASKQESIEELARKYNVDLVMNAVDPTFNEKNLRRGIQRRRNVYGYGDDTFRAESDRSIPQAGRQTG